MKKRDVIRALLILTALAVALGFGIFCRRSLETGAWGLSFREAGAAPLGNATSRELRSLDAAYLGDPEQKVLYLTFDAGYENGNMAKILDTLQKHHAKGAFFLVGNFIEKNGDLVRRMAQEGHTVGNHTMHHPDMSGIRDPGYRTVFWSLAYVDWKNDDQPSPDYAFGKLIPRTHPGAVVLLPLTSKTNGEIMEELLTKWEEMGYSFGDVGEIF